MANFGKSDAQRQHVAQVRALASQIGNAISAIEHNDLLKLQDSVSAQHTLCCQLAETRLLLPERCESGIAPTAREVELREELREAYVALGQMNRIYTALLKRAERSCVALAAVYRTHTQGYSKDSPSPPERRNLSCEV